MNETTDRNRFKFVLTSNLLFWFTHQILKVAN